MPTIAEVRQKFPDYNDMSDTELAGALHKKFYSDLPEAEFNAKIGLKPTASTAPSVPISDSQYAPGQPSPTAGLTQVPITGAPPDDHGLARRQAMSPVEKALSPITEYPRHQQEISGETLHQIGRGFNQIGEGAFGSGLAGDTGKFAAGLGNVGFGAANYAFSPLISLYRSIIGQPLEDVTGIPREQTEMVAQLATPGIGFAKLAQAPGTIPRGPLIRPVDVQRDVVGEAAERLRGYTPAPAEVPRAVTGGPTTQATGQYLSNAPYAGQPIAETVKTTLPQQLEQTRNAVAAEYGAGTGANVAERVGATLKEQAAAEKAAAEAEATAANAKATADWEAANQAREAAIATPEQAAAQRAQQTGEAAQQTAGPDLPVRDMSRANIDRTRTAHDTLETRKNDLYAEAGSLNARISDNANSAVHGYVERSLEHAGINVKEITKIQATKDMMSILDRFAEGAKARAELAPVGQSMQEVEQLRKNLRAAAATAENPTDERAAKHIMDALDDWQAKATKNHLMPGSDPRAYPAFLDARSANRELMEKFGYNKHDDADKLINKIVRGEVDQFTGENEIAKALTDSGDKGPLFHRKLMNAVNNDPEVSQSIRSGTWNRLTRNDRGEPLSPKEVQKNVTAYLEGKNRTLAEQVFTPEQRQLMRTHADTVVAHETAQEIATAARKAAAKEAKATAPEKIEPVTGDMQKLVEQVIGGKTNEAALFNTLHGYARKGGDVKQLARVVSQLPTEMRGDLSGAFVRELGIAPGTKQFSLDHFANQWATLTPQAKTVLFGNAGPHVTALNDIAIVANKLKTIKGKYGNPSGTAQNTLFGLLVSAAAAAPYAPKTAAATLGAAAGGRMLANVLAKPAGASSALKYAQAVERAERQQSPIHMAAVKASQRNLANTARSLLAADK